MGIKDFFQNLRKEGKVEDHLIAFLQDEYQVEIVEKYKAFLLIVKGKIIKFFYNAKELREYLETSFKREQEVEEQIQEVIEVIKETEIEKKDEEAHPDCEKE